MAQEHVARIKGTTSASGLDVFAANEKVREQQRAIAALRLEVRRPRRVCAWAAARLSLN